MLQTTIARPEKNEYREYYGKYIAMVPDGDIIDILQSQNESTRRLLSGLSEAQAMHRYAPGKWSVKEVIGHLCDAERVFAYRAMRFARADQTPLPGFDEETYVPAGRFDERSLGSLVEEYGAVRGNTIALLRGLPDEASRRAGDANGAVMSVRALAYVIAGHEVHHISLLRERYGISG